MKDLALMNSIALLLTITANMKNDHIYHLKSFKFYSQLYKTYQKMYLKSALTLLSYFQI